MPVNAREPSSAAHEPAGVRPVASRPTEATNEKRTAARLRPRRSPAGPPSSAPGIQPKNTSDLLRATSSTGKARSRAIELSRKMPVSVPKAMREWRATMTTQPNMMP